MDLVSLRLQKAEKALRTLEEVLKEDISNDIIRDSAIQRFEYTIEALWKALKSTLAHKYKLKTSNPRDVIRESVAQNFLTAEGGELFLKMLDYRNQTSHEYAIDIADKVAPHIPAFAKLARSVLQKV